MDNLKPDYLKNMTPEQRKEAGRKGGIKSGESRRRKRMMKDMLEILMTVPLKKSRKGVVKTEDIKNLAEVNDYNLSTEQAILLALIQKALSGDVQAFTVIRDTLGEKPIDKLEVDSNEVVVIKDDI